MALPWGGPSLVPVNIDSSGAPRFTLAGGAEAARDDRVVRLDGAHGRTQIAFGYCTAKYGGNAMRAREAPLHPGGAVSAPSVCFWCEPETAIERVRI